MLIRSKLITTGVVLGFLVLICTESWLTLSNLEKETKVSITKSLQSLLHSTHEAIHLWITSEINAIDKFTNSDEIIEITKILMDDGSKINKDLAISNIDKLIHEKFLKQEYLDLLIISPEYTIQNLDIKEKFTAELDIQRKQLVADVFKLGRTVFIPPILSKMPIKKNNTVNKSSYASSYILSPVRVNDKIIAAVVVIIDPYSYFMQIAKLGIFGNTGHTYAFDRSGLLLSESRFTYQLKQAGIININEKAKFNLRLYDPGANLVNRISYEVKNNPNKPLTKMADNATRGYSGIDINGYSDYRGVEVLGAWIWDKWLGFGLAVEIDKSEAMQLFSDTKHAIIILLIFVVGLSIVTYIILVQNHREIERRLELNKYQLEEKVNERTNDLKLIGEELKKKNIKLEILAVEDPLTRLANRRAFDLTLTEEWQRSYRYKRSLALLIIDVDYFKKYNDHYGHQQGDVCLQQVADVLREANVASRPGDLVARYGGEEFAIILSDTNIEYAHSIANNIQKLIRKKAIPHAKTTVKNMKIVSLSIGVTSFSKFEHSNQDELIEVADKALYRAKDNGRNQIVCIEQSV